ncbi:MAG: tetratricopeptide repeat protein [Bacteroidales bacterium]|jgi:tetratricopeptide (TPR) repeat protein|nr:tetratricopeptide repeat protein [Bacteroidales bacterium]
MANKISEKEAARQENIEQTVSKTNQFFTENKKLLITLTAVVAVLVLAALAYNKFVYQPKCEEAMAEAVAAENNFAAGNYDLALNGDGNVLGFTQIIEDYGTKSGKDVYLYAGLCALQLGQYEDAIDYLKKYKGKDDILTPRAVACTGDAYVGLEDYEAALKCYNSAASMKDNVFAAAYLVKAGMVYEKLGDKAAALECYKKVEDKYPQSIEAYDIQKYITRVSE